MQSLENKKAYSKPTAEGIPQVHGVVGVACCTTDQGRKIVLASVPAEDLTGKGKREMVLFSDQQRLRAVAASQLSTVSGGLDAGVTAEDQVLTEFYEEWQLQLGYDRLQQLPLDLRVIQWRNGSTNAYVDFLVDRFFLLELYPEELQQLCEQKEAVILAEVEELLDLPQELFRPLTIGVLQLLSKYGGL